MKPFQLLSKKNSGISPSMNLSQSFSLSLLDLHLTFKVDILNTNGISHLSEWDKYQLSEFGIRKSVEISSHTVVPSIFKNNENKLFLISPFTTNIKTENLLWVVSGILCVCLLKEEICRTKRLYWEILQASSLVKTWYQ